jgi:HAD superfamily hydrolase (TIGR01509 family)
MLSIAIIFKQAHLKNSSTFIILSKNENNNLEMKSIKAVLFDMDGVLLDTMPYHESAWSQLFKEEGIPFDPKEAYYNEGRTGYSMIETVFEKAKGEKPSLEDISEMYQRKKSIMKNNPPIKNIKDMPQVLTYLKEQNIKIGVVTGSGQKDIIKTLQQFYPDIVIKENIISGFDVKKGKPHPEPYLKALERVGITAEEALVIENAPLGVESAIAANIYTIAINTGILDDDVLKDAGANMVCRNSKELLQILQEKLN